jgi:phage-related protein
VFAKSRPCHYADTVVSSAPRRRDRLTVRYFKTSTGRELFKEELDALGRDAKAELIGAIKRRRDGTHFAREEEHVVGPIHAVRTTLDGCEYRALYALLGRHDQVFLGLHALSKKSRKLPKSAIDKAQKRLAAWEEEGRRLTGARKELPGALKHISAKTDRVRNKKEVPDETSTSSGSAAANRQRRRRG